MSFVDYDYDDGNRNVFTRFASTSATNAFVAVALALTTSSSASAAQVMNEVWYPRGKINWYQTQASTSVQRGICDAVSYYKTRTPIKFTELEDYDYVGGLKPTSLLGLDPLEIRYSSGVFNGGYSGQAKHYRKPNLSDKLIKLSVARVTTRHNAKTVLAHEFGHALGFTHEFQRWDRAENGVSVSLTQGRDPFNFGRPDRKKVRVLTPYDFQSQYSAGYTVTPAPFSPPMNSLLSVHDINAIYRVYGQALGSNEDGLRFGQAATSGDFDGDGFEDLAVAAKYSKENAATGAVYFFRGVAQAPDESGGGETYMPWFTETIQFGSSDDRRIVLASGDSHELAPDLSTDAQRDGIDEVYVGLPDSDVVQIWVVNGLERFRNHQTFCTGESLSIVDVAPPWGAHGVAAKITIRAEEVGAGTNSDFGAAIVSGRFFSGGGKDETRGDDLVIGAPAGSIASTVTQSSMTIVSQRRRRPVSSVQASDLVDRPPAVYMLPESTPADAIAVRDPEFDQTSEFGKTLTVMPDFDEETDTIVVGAPGATVGSVPDYGRIYLYKRPGLDRSSGSWQPPTLSGRLPGSNTMIRVDSSPRRGAALVAFRTRQHGGVAKHWLAVGAPDAERGGVKCGEAVLYEVEFEKDPTGRQVFSAGACDAGARIGASLAVHQGQCSLASCPQENTWLAVGAPHYKIDNDVRGAVHLFDIWTGTRFNSNFVERWDGPSKGSRWGHSILGFKPSSDGGGFVVMAKRGDVVRKPGMVVPELVESGITRLHLNLGTHAKWKSWSKDFTPSMGADMAPKNL